MAFEYWILLLVALYAVYLFISYMRRQLRRSREVDKTIDYTKMRPWEDEDD